MTSRSPARVCRGASHCRGTPSRSSTCGSTPCWATSPPSARSRTPPTAPLPPTWPAEVHLIGKDILRFHAVYWPAMLLSAGLTLPDKVFAHGWLLVGGEKMSKTKLTGIAPETITEVFGSDAFRYYFLRAINFGSDGSFSWEDMRDRYTSELANGLETWRRAVGDGDQVLRRDPAGTRPLQQRRPVDPGSAGPHGPRR